MSTVFKSLKTTGKKKLYFDDYSAQNIQFEKYCLKLVF